MVVKPIHSSSGKGVKLVKIEDRKSLKCYLPGGKHTNLNQGKHFFHQKYVKYLLDFGELRILIARNTTQKAMDGLLPPGDIISIIGDEEAQKRKYEELQKFALVCSYHLGLVTFAESEKTSESRYAPRYQHHRSVRHVDATGEWLSADSLGTVLRDGKYHARCGLERCRGADRALSFLIYRDIV
ncbi:hypothetical protein Micbo1qcDRAFT_181198 [Microdochium bolleyi]|uniref:Uncharacterized protein n=1 Tax=Microdochium bolleyi TaxID=196109 RepID=A0A136IJ13_9PEZI|nr:hypothetical protein Micbo1qcDRAFT_181198 [Microdochium bolleyi]